MPIDILLFRAWQRWELEVCHREIKSGFDLSQKTMLEAYRRPHLCPVECLDLLPFAPGRLLDREAAIPLFRRFGCIKKPG